MLLEKHKQGALDSSGNGQTRINNPLLIKRTKSDDFVIGLIRKTPTLKPRNL